jgi:hypothetical protein
MKGKRKTIWRKQCKDTTSLKEWSRMLHLWWKKDVVSKIEFKREKT